jgi:hypothetical protein
MSRLKTILKSDSEYKTFKLVVEKCGLLADFDNLTKEMEIMHKARKSRDLAVRTPSVDRIMKAASQASAYRSRIVEIMISVQKAQRNLDSAIDRMEAHILTKYRVHVTGRSINDRKLELKSLLDKAYKKLSDFNRIVDMCKELIADIESFMWNAKLQMQGLELIYTREDLVKTKVRR